MIHYQGSRIPNLGILNCVERVAQTIPAEMLALRTRLIIKDVCDKHLVSKSLASQAVSMARVWSGIRSRLGDSGAGDGR